MVNKAMQNLPYTGAARSAGAAQEQRPVGRKSINHNLLAPPISHPWPLWPCGPMAC